MAEDNAGQSVDEQLFEAARSGDVATLAALLDRHPEKLRSRTEPYGLTLLHLAAFAGHLAVVDRLIAKGADVNARDTGDNTCPMHWAAAGGHLEVVRRLADAGGDVVGHGDDHALEVIGWASCWNGCDDDAHRAVVRLLLDRGARHHIFSAIALNLEDEVRRIVGADASTLSRALSHNEDFQRPLHFAVRMNRPRMVELLLELGADPLATDGSGYLASAYATLPDVDRALMEALRDRGNEDIFAALALHDWETATRLLRDNPDVVRKDGILHQMAKRSDIAAVEWLLDHGANPNTLWAHWDARVTPLHLAVLGGHPDVVRPLLAAGANPRIADTKHHSDAIGWATFFGRQDMAGLLSDYDSPEAT